MSELRTPNPELFLISFFLRKKRLKQRKGINKRGNKQLKIFDFCCFFHCPISSASLFRIFYQFI
ncbi:unknown [Crocosphaera subtropica ATCC 51142]|uniref:Uncharacterized protein n=1 Tax=Crocosphaera subtropica (strain ATCC 51142 / BH68) TaxID=43989 RepID=B1WR99_CROS5|nr:unknown [Crocosphaera subtropica ATCC 51142]